MIGQLSLRGSWLQRKRDGPWQGCLQRKQCKEARGPARAVRWTGGEVVRASSPPY